MRIGRLQWLAAACCTFAVGGAYAQIDGGGGGARSVAPRAEEGLREPRDAQLALEVQNRLGDELGNKALSAEVENGVATLRGDAASEDQRNEAGRLARRVDGVTQVRNEIVVNPQAAHDANHGKANAAADTDDTVAANEHTKPTHDDGSDRATKREQKRALDEEVTAKIRSESTLLGNDIKVDVDKDGTVTLTGEVGSLANRDLAGRLAAETDGVTQVRNKLSVRGS